MPLIVEGLVMSMDEDEEPAKSPGGEESFEHLEQDQDGTPMPANRVETEVSPLCLVLLRGPPCLVLFAALLASLTCCRILCISLCRLTSAADKTEQTDRTDRTDSLPRKGASQTADAMLIVLFLSVNS